MIDADLNLIVALDALLAEGAATSAARRLGPSSSAMGRPLTRLQSATGSGPKPITEPVERRIGIHREGRAAQVTIRREGRMDG